jgi:hypothetical protein
MIEGNEVARDTPNVFWGEIAPCEHILQIYQRDADFLTALEGFVSGGLVRDEAVVVIATPEHLAGLEERLRRQSISINIARSRDQYIPIDAEYLMSQFLVNDWPDDDKFEQVVSNLLKRARGSEGRPVRAFGEMVAIMWAKGQTAATVRLEHLWHSFCHSESFSLFCAYPKAGFTQDATESIKQICDAHSHVVMDTRIRA